ncbi:MAG: hypothetical protein ABSD45_18745 [Terriglobia bacterium]|jgi:hypothetical protein
MSRQALSDLLDPHEPEKPPKLTIFDYVTKLILPVLALVAVILTRSQKQTALAWGLLGFAFLSLLAAFYPQIASFVKEQARSRRDERIAKRAFPELRKLIYRFGEFVGSNSDTLHYIFQSEVCGNNPYMVTTRLGLPSLDIFQGFWATVRDQAASEKPNLASFRGTASAFNMLVALYNNHCMYVVFERLPQELWAQVSGLPKQVEEQVDWERMGRRPPGQLADSARRSLEACRERFNAFLDAYENFLGSLDERLTERHSPIRKFPRATLKLSQGRSVVRLTLAATRVALEFIARWPQFGLSTDDLSAHKLVIVR